MMATGLQEQAPTYNAMGNVLKAARRGEEAMQAYESALELDPEFAVAHFNLGALRHAQGCVARLQSSPAASCLFVRTFTQSPCAPELCRKRSAALT